MIFASQPPHVACATVSTTEGPVTNRLSDCPIRADVSEEEQAAIRFLIKECGWYWIEAGVLRRHRYAAEAA